MPRSALPPRLQSFDWKGTDNASWLMRQKKKIQILLAAGPRVPSGFFRWRDIPITLFATYGKKLDVLRLESSSGHKRKGWMSGTMMYEKGLTSDIYNSRGRTEMPMYLSRIQPWCRWHVALQWPLFFNCHFIYRAKNVVKYRKYQSAFGIKKMVTFGFGFKRDGDKVYWLTANMGGNFE